MHGLNPLTMLEDDLTNLHCSSLGFNVLGFRAGCLDACSAFEHARRLPDVLALLVSYSASSWGGLQM